MGQDTSELGTWTGRKEETRVHTPRGRRALSENWGPYHKALEMPRTPFSVAQGGFSSVIKAPRSRAGH